MPRYIDAEMAKKEFNLNFGGISHAVIANQIIDGIPTADVIEVKHGYWIATRNDSFTYVEKCSECGYIEEYNIDPDNGISPKYCPECGAIMDGGNE